MLSQKIKNVPHPPLGLFPTYCFDPGVDFLRAIYNLGSQTTVRNNIGTFQQHKVSMNQTTTLNSIKAITAHIEELRGAALTEADFVPAPDLEKNDPTAIRVADSVITSGIASSIPPIYLERASHNHASGQLQISVVIGRDGRLHMMKLISTPDVDLAISALTAARQWTYQPYLLIGKPTEVQTLITINFTFSPPN
jgi:outer membrane biosynthesis protein TonB